VIADAQVAVAIAGVMGGELSGVTDATVDILLESAQFNPQAGPAAPLAGSGLRAIRVTASSAASIPPRSLAASDRAHANSFSRSPAELPSL